MTGGNAGFLTFGFFQLLIEGLAQDKHGKPVSVSRSVALDPSTIAVVIDCSGVPKYPASVKFEI